MASSERRFARLSARPTGRLGTFGIPEDGMCLSVYLLVRPTPSSRQVLAGRVDPTGPWASAACLDAERLRSVADRWILPATQLVFFEGPDEAAQRIAHVLLGCDDLRPEGPRVFNEVYGRGPERPDPHWDLQFVYAAVWPSGEPPSRGRLWQELRFLDVEGTESREFGRGHGDVLALAGFPPRPSAVA
jgi:hypothetical protein